MAQRTVLFAADLLRLAFGNQGQDEYTGEFGRRLALALEPIGSDAAVGTRKPPEEGDWSTYVALPSRRCAVEVTGLAAAADYLGPGRNPLARLLFTLALGARLSHRRLPWTRPRLLYVQRTDLVQGELIFERNHQFQFFNSLCHTILHLAKPGIGEQGIGRDVDTRQRLSEHSTGIHVPSVLATDARNRYFVDELVRGRGRPTLGHYSASELRQLLEQLVQVYRDAGPLRWRPATEHYRQVRSDVTEALRNHPQVQGLIHWAALDGLLKHLLEACGKGEALEVAVVPLAHGDMLVSNNTLITGDGLLYIIDWGEARSANLLYDTVSMIALDYIATPPDGLQRLRQLMEHADLYPVIETLLHQQLDLTISRAETAVYVFLSVLELVAVRVHRTTLHSPSPAGEEDPGLAWNVLACCQLLEGLFGLGSPAKDVSPATA